MLLEHLAVPGKSCNQNTCSRLHEVKEIIINMLLGRSLQRVYIYVPESDL